MSDEPVTYEEFRVDSSHIMWRVRLNTTINKKVHSGYGKNRSDALLDFFRRNDSTTLDTIFQKE